MLINIPVTPFSGGTGTYEQLIFTDSNFSAAKLVGLNSVSSCIGANDWYFGGPDGKIYKYGGSTNADGTNTSLTYQSPFSEFDVPGQQKHFTEIYALLSTQGSVGVGVDVLTDYEERTLADPPLTAVSDVMEWGDAWGGVWMGTLQRDIRKFGVSAVGYAGSLKLAAQTQNGKLYLNRVLLRFHVGGEN